ncbi:cytokine receptor family member b1 isoform X2 [Chelmon rostratus]|uniref:cytokine receptor family member b1 isoform X2 n=1 Tax=Chelmon rostratus TaxID=109905 RepID=UPI001BEA7EFB|nr:cytokine receptor family member b1 isoform X2 [Chelmon rostratus]
MNGLPLVLYLTLLLDSVLASLPAPVNVSIHSINFHHVLRWDPGPGTPPGTHYQVFRVRKRNWKQLAESTTTSAQLDLKKYRESYVLTVLAAYNQTQSAVGPRIVFTPYQDTVIDPPALSLTGCGNCIQISISLPEADRSSGVDDIHSFYGAEYQVQWKKRFEKTTTSYLSTNKSFTLTNLQEGTEYCVQVEAKLLHNKCTKPSAWVCTFTSVVEPSRGPAVVGAVAALLIFVFGALMTSMFCLYYTGFICKLKATLPRVLVVALGQGLTLSPERTVPDRISVSPDMEKQRRHNNPAAPQPPTGGANSEEEEDEDEEDEEGINIYMNRAAELSSGESSCRNPGDMSGTPAASGDSGRFTEEARGPEFEGADEDEAAAEGAEVSFSPERSQTGIQTHATGEVVEEEEVFDCSGNVNLFSVTLSALAACEEEEQNSRDFLKLSDQEPLLHRDSQTASDDQTAEDFTSTWYEGRRAVALSGCLRTCDGGTQHEEEEEEEEDEDEEEFSGYMKHT